MSYNHAISAGDPQAKEKLTAKLDICVKLQELMKSVNAYWRKSGTCKGAPGITDEQATKLEDKIAHGYSWEKQPFSSYELTNNNAEVKRLQKRIDEIARNREIGFAGWKFEGGEAVVNTELNRLQLIFDERPTAERCGILKHKGFHWSPSENAWQRQLNDNAVYALNYVEFVKPLNGKRPTDLQPKAPQRDDGAR